MRPRSTFLRAPLSWMDFKLGFRMLLRYPGLTVVGGIAIAFAIAIGAAAFQLMTFVAYPSLPLDDGDRVVGIRLWHTAASGVEEQASYDFATWRGRLETVDDLGAFRTLRRNLIALDGSAEPVEVAEISASAFRVARVPALLGRFLDESDERPDAAAVVVIGYGVWQARFAGNPAVVGQSLRLGSAPNTVVGVMPQGFEFPVAHDVWLPLRVNLAETRRRQGPEINVFGRLAPGVTLDQAQAELTTIGLRATADFPDTHEHLRPQVLPYPKSILDLSGWESIGMMSINLLVVMLVALVCGNVALLMFARATTRESELVVRSALGASRRRIIMQLFTEALVLGGVGAVLGLATARAALRWGLGAIQAEFLDGGGRFPFWFSDSLSPATALYAGALTVLGAVIAGVVPGLRVTRALETQLRQTSAGAGGGLRFGGLWTAVIVTQVAVTLAFPALAFYVRRNAAQIMAMEVGFPAEEYLSTRLGMDRENASGAPIELSREALLTRFRASFRELERRLKAEPNVSGVTFADLLPRMYHPARYLEVDEGGAAPLDPRWPGYRVSSAAVDTEYFQTVRAPILTGRAFHSGDLASDTRVAIVNQSFVRRVLEGRNPIGRHVRDIGANEAGESAQSAKPGPWYEIVGVVVDMGMSHEPDPKVAGFYRPLLPADIDPIHMAVHVKGDPAAFAGRLRAIASAIDPTLRVDRVQPLDQVNSAELQFLDFWFRLTAVVSSVAMLLSLAGIYAVMSFTVSRRTREIGIRIALGARPRRVILAILRRPLMQVGVGIVAGTCLVTGLSAPIHEGGLSVTHAAVIAGYAAVMTAVCMLACIVPARRALSVEPTEALRDG